MLGLSSTAGCAVVCGPALLPFILAEGKSVRPVLLFLAGRLTAYLFFALFAGSLGVYFEGRIHPDILALLTIILSIWLIAYAAGKTSTNTFFCRTAGKQLPFFAGIVMGISPCPPFLLGLDRILQMHAIAAALVFFAGFFAGSSLWLFALMSTDKLINHRAALLTGRAASFLAGAFYLWKGTELLIR